MKLTTRRDILAGTAAVCSAAVVSPNYMSKAKASGELPATHKVEIRKFKFVPDHLAVKPGDTIIWTNLDIAPHTATANDKSWDTGRLNKGQSKSVVVSNAMTAEYYCRFHPSMKAGLQIE